MAVDPTSVSKAALISKLANSLWGGRPGFNTNQFGVNWFTVGPSEARTNVQFFDCQRKGYVPAGLTGAGGVFTSVPIPAMASPTGGSDKQLTIYQPATDTLWDFWRAEKSAAGQWTACWGGKIDNFSKNPGYFSGHFGASASGMVHQLGAISISDIRRGRIDHAIGLELPADAVASGAAWPAQRSDGRSGNPDAVKIGTRLRLDPALRVSEMRLTPIGEMIARAAQEYGFIVTDTSGAVAVKAESSVASQALTGVNPWASVFAKSPQWKVFENFPWEKLQVLAPVR